MDVRVCALYNKSTSVVLTVIQTMQSRAISVYTYRLNFRDTAETLCMTEQSDGIHADNISLVANITGIEAREEEDMNIIIYCVLRTWIMLRVLKSVARIVWKKWRGSAKLHHAAKCWEGQEDDGSEWMNRQEMLVLNLVLRLKCVRYCPFFLKNEGNQC
jgi:hypothetical protein